MALEAGAKLGHYEVLSSLGAGGMGEVCRAKDTKLGREVAIKLLLEEVSGDPERLARFERDGRLLKKVSLLGGPSLTICESPGFLQGSSWGEDGHIVFGAFGQRQLYRVSEAGGDPEILLAAPDDARRSYLLPKHLAGRRAMLLTIQQGTNRDEDTISLLHLDTGEVETLVPGGTHAVYTPNGYLVYGIDGTLRAVGFDLDRLEVTSNPVPVVEGVVTKASGVVNFDISASGTLVYAQGGGALSGDVRTLAWVDRAGNEEAIAVAPDTYQYPRLSPEGDRLAVGIFSAGQDLWMWDLERATMSRLTFTPAMEIYPIWTPDGKSIVFDSNRDNVPGIYTKAADGTGTVEAIETEAEEWLPSSLTSDGRSIFARRGITSEHDIGIIPLDGSGPPEVLIATEFDEANPEISPDGRWLAYESNKSGRFEVYVQPFPELEEGHWQVSTAGGRAPVWSRDGKELFYIADAADFELLAVDIESEPGFRAGTPSRLFGGPYLVGIGRGYDVATDGDRFVVVKTGGSTADDSRIQVVLVQNWLGELERLVPVD